MKKVVLSDITENLDKRRVPVSSAIRSKQFQKIYPYYGAQGIVDYVDDFLFDGDFLLVAEDGENLRSQRTNVCTYATGKFWVNNHAHILDAKPGNNLKYIYYRLSLVNFRPFVTGSAQPKLTQDVLSNIPLTVHDEDDQNRIAGLLSALDAKIALNTRINAELEALAKLIYDYWFVQFDFPISAAQAKRMGKPNLAGKPYKSSGGAMVYNQELKREVPEGWEVGTLLDIADYENGLACQRFRPSGPEFLRVIKIREMRDGFTADSEHVRPDIPSKAIIENGDVLFSWSASLEVMIWSGGKGALNQHIFKVTSKEYPKSFFYHQLRNYLQHFKMMAENRKTTMGHITQEHLVQSRIVIPPLALINQLDEKIAPLLQLQVANNIQNQELTTLRDWLLPLLMNGQVRVSAPLDVTPAKENVGLALAAEPAGRYGKKKG